MLMVGKNGKNHTIAYETSVWDRCYFNAVTMFSVKNMVVNKTGRVLWVGRTQQENSI